MEIYGLTKRIHNDCIEIEYDRLDNDEISKLSYLVS